MVNLSLILRDKKYERKMYVEFEVVHRPLAYNVILGRSILSNHDILIYMGLLCLKMPTPSGIAIMRGSQKSA